MMAGDLTQCLPIIQKAEKYFTGRANTLATARAVFKRAFSQHLVEMREDAVLSGYGLTMKEFLRTGKRRFTENLFESICKKIAEVKANCEFIITGFDSQKRPHIFNVTEEGKDGVYNKPGYYCIGTGKWAAETILYTLGQSVDLNLYQTIFNVCAAKFMAEKSSDVGKATYLYARKPGSNVFTQVSGMIETIRGAWENDGCPRIPEGIIKALTDIYYPRCE